MALEETDGPDVAGLRGSSVLGARTQNGLLPLAALIAFQALCVAVFLVDVVNDLFEIGPGLTFDRHLIPELAATLGLIVGIAFEISVLMRLLRRQASLEKGLGLAAGALAELMETYFRDWGLTPSEQDVAAFTIKGFSIAEIARMRGSAEATVKAHLNAIYRKSGAAGRAQLVSLLVEDLLRAPLPGAVPHGGGNLPPEAAP